MVGLSRRIGWAALTVGGLFWHFRRRAKRRNQIKREKQANNGKQIASPDPTGAEASLVRNTQELELYVRVWPTNGELRPRGVVLFVHSYSGDSQYFTEFAKVLNNSKFHVVAFDLQSHGLSGTSTGCKGDVFSFQDLVNDLESVLHYARKQFPELPVFLIGEGFGASIALQFSSRQDREVEGLVLVSPMVKTTSDGVPPFHINSFLKTAEKVSPESRICTSEFLKAINNERSDLDKIQTPTLRLLVQVNKCLAQVERDLHKIEIPFLAIHGELDTRAPSLHSKELIEKASSKDKELLVYDNMHSPLLLEPPENQERVFHDIISWLKDHTINTNIQKTKLLTTDFEKSDVLSTDHVEIKLLDEVVQEASRSIKDEAKLERFGMKQRVVCNRLELNGY